MKQITGNLISLALNNEFDVIAHGTNCFCIQGAGIAKQMAETFGTNTFKFEDKRYTGNINKLGCIDYMNYEVKMSGAYREDYKGVTTSDLGFQLTVVNAYTQYNLSKNLDLDALALCMKKINHLFSGLHVGLPRIGCGIGGGDWSIVKGIIAHCLRDCEVTIVNYK